MLLIMCFTVYSAPYASSISWHPVQQAVKSASEVVSIDYDDDKLIDNAESLECSDCLAVNDFDGMISVNSSLYPAFSLYNTVHSGIFRLDSKIYFGIDSVYPLSVSSDSLSSLLNLESDTVGI
ncbi:hypothetical protein K9M79_02470 [Candidatus Woesearchaeota archaeon]|nr:hypothetical protein [Candidatus Woesearchaeota archaeon]